MPGDGPLARMNREKDWNEPQEKENSISLYRGDY